MKRSIRTMVAFVITAMMMAGMNVYAQNEEINESRSVSISTTDDGKVKLKVITKRGNDSETFEKTYDSHEDMENDPELKEKGIDISDNWSWGSGVGRYQFGGLNNMLSIFRSGSPFDNDDDNSISRSFSFGFDLDSLMDNMDHFRSGSPFFFRFGPGGTMDVDSLMQKFDFHKDGGKFFLNGEEFEDMDALREKLREQFDGFDFNFDFGDWDDRRNGANVFFFGNDDGDNDRGHIVSRARVFIRTARDADKEAVGADEMDELEFNNISFYPNPSDGRFNLELDTGNGGPIQIKIIDPNGTVVYDKRDQSTRGRYDFNIDISEHDKGIYILQVIQNNSALTKRIIIE